MELVQDASRLRIFRAVLQHLQGPLTDSIGKARGLQSARLGVVLALLCTIGVCIGRDAIVSYSEKESSEEIMKNFIVGLMAMVGLVLAGLILYGVGSLIVGLIGIVVTVVVAAAPFVLGAASVIFIVFGGAYALGKAILESGKE